MSDAKESLVEASDQGQIHAPHGAVSSGMSILRRIRGVLGMGLIWAVACGFVGGMPRWVFGVNTDAPLGLVFAVFGFAAGVIFSSLIAITERRRSFEQMSLARFAAWGGVGGFLLAAAFARATSLALGDLALVVPTFTLAAAALSSGSLALARRSGRGELAAGSESVGEVEPGWMSEDGKNG